METLEPRILITNDPTYVENGYTLSFQDGGPCWIIDPGFPPQAHKVVEHIREHDLTPQCVVLTHAHADHIGGLDAIRRAYPDLPVHLAREEWAALTDPMENLSGLFGPGFATEVTDPVDLAPGATLELNGAEWIVLDVSGHSPGGRALFCRELGMAFVGDALFAGSVGRVDFPHSDGARLINNIRSNLMSLPDETRILSGHGPETTIGHERQTNPFILYGL